MTDTSDTDDTHDTHDTGDTGDTGDTPDTPDTRIVITHNINLAPTAVRPRVMTVPASAATSAQQVGIDSIDSVSQALLTNASSSSYVGQAPQFWGRYFYAPGQLNAAGNKDSHYAASESALLRAKGIRVLPIARQTALVGGNAAQATNDAKNNIAALFEVFPAAYLSGADPDILMFLDVEPDNPLSVEYYTAWSATLISEAAGLSNNRVRVHPAIYGNHGDVATWTALNTAVAGDAVCDGIWVARYYFPSPQPHAWIDALVAPSVTLPCPILAWQYWSSPDHSPESANFDATLVNQPHADMLISRLVMPPSS